MDECVCVCVRPYCCRAVPAGGPCWCRGASTRSACLRTRRCTRMVHLCWGACRLNASTHPSLWPSSGRCADPLQTDMDKQQQRADHVCVCVWCLCHFHTHTDVPFCVHLEVRADAEPHVPLVVPQPLYTHTHAHTDRCPRTKKPHAAVYRFVVDVSEECGESAALP